ncbi:hypothetical protein D3C80_514650 [compost metagenome]
MFEPGNSWFVENYGKLKVYQDAKYLYFEYENIDNNYEYDYLIYVGPENILIQDDPEKKTKYFHQSKTPKYKIPLNTFSPNEKVAILFYSKYRIDGDEGYFYSDNLAYVAEEGLPEYKYDYVGYTIYPRYFLYTINPCCRPNE